MLRIITIIILIAATLVIAGLIVKWVIELDKEWKRDHKQG